MPLAEMWEVFNMGCGFVATVPEDRAQEAADDPGRAPPRRPADRHGLAIAAGVTTAPGGIELRA